MITKSTTDLSSLDFNSGEIILIDKPFGWSSFKVIYEIRKSISEKKVGHAGTLDPAATGLLIVCTGKKTKSISSFQELAKTYTGSIRLGVTSASMDLETELIEIDDLKNITEAKILSAIKNFTGTIMQIPPMYSAVKVGGKSLYHLARKGKTVEREPRQITIYNFKVNKIQLPEIHFEITCSKGTYIRAIADDLGKVLGCGGILSSLRRTKIGTYSVDDALTVDEFVNNCQNTTCVSLLENIL